MDHVVASFKAVAGTRDRSTFRPICLQPAFSSFDHRAFRSPARARSSSAGYRLYSTGNASLVYFFRRERRDGAFYRVMDLARYLDVVQRPDRVSNDGTFVCRRVYRSLAFQKATKCLNFLTCWACWPPGTRPAAGWVGAMGLLLTMRNSSLVCEAGAGFFGAHPARHSPSISVTA